MRAFHVDIEDTCTHTKTKSKPRFANRAKEKAAPPALEDADRRGGGRGGGGGGGGSLPGRGYGQ
jgi:hypothetical protein